MIAPPRTTAKRCTPSKRWP